MKKELLQKHYWSSSKTDNYNITPPYFCSPAVVSFNYVPEQRRHFYLSNTRLIVVLYCVIVWVTASFGTVCAADVGMSLGGELQHAEYIYSHCHSLQLFSLPAGGRLIVICGGECDMQIWASCTDHKLVETQLRGQCVRLWICVWCSTAIIKRLSS